MDRYLWKISDEKLNKTNLAFYSKFIKRHYKVNSENDCFCSFSEWGYALSMNKTLILDIDKRNPKLKEYYMYAIQSLDSLEKLKYTRKHAIIKYHPDLEVNDYNSYRGFMMHIISIK